MDIDNDYSVFFFVYISYFVTGHSGLLVTETTNSVFNAELYANNVTANSVLEFYRVMIANWYFA
jgi:hypothetical protein